MRVNYYYLIHKALRREIFQIAVNLGKINYNNRTELLSVYQSFREMVELQNHHSDNEEKFLHPFISTKLPSHVKSLNKEHELIEMNLSRLELSFKNLLNGISSNKDISTAGCRLYLDFNQFIAIYLNHIDQEEIVMSLLWEHFTDEELAPPLTGLVSSFTSEMLIHSVQYMLPALTSNEQITYLTKLKGQLSHSDFQKVLGTVERVLATSEYLQIIDYFNQGKI